MTFTLHIAGPDDDAEIRALLARNPVPGRVVVSYEREPSYFAGCRTMGHFSQVVVARDGETGRLAAVACRSVRRRYVDGRERDVGYIGQLRVDVPYRGRWLVSRGFRYLADLDDDGRADEYITSITREGDVARRLLVELRRPHYPQFQRLDAISTLALPAIGSRAPRPAAELPGDGEVEAFLATEGPRREYFPVWDPGEAAGRTVVALRRDGRLAGTLILWDQSACKQAVVRGYAPSLGRVRPLYNAVMRARRRPVLPAVGEQIRFAFASYVCVREDDPAVFRELLDRARHEAAARGIDYVMLGLSTRDPLARVAKRCPHIEYSSTLYRVCWNGRGERRERSDTRIPYVEIATL